MPENNEANIGKNQKKKKKKKRMNPWLALLIKLAIMGYIAFLALTYVFGVSRMRGNNMFPASKDGDLCITYKLERYNIGDVVLYTRADGQKKLSRIVALPGQTVYFPESGGFIVDGVQPTEEITYPTYLEDGGNREIKVPEGAYYLMNDFRSDQSDSRKFGPVYEDVLEGKLMFLLRRRGF